MKDSIYTIPISEVFEPRKGCPVCALRNTLEQRSVEYIMGAAMMEPDVRMETNRLGFCALHYEQMLHQKNRLSLALMLESHLKELKDHGVDAILKRARTKAAKREGSPAFGESCFVCEKIEEALSKMLANTVDLYRKDPGFRQLFGEQEALCLPHLEALLCAAADRLPKKEYPDFEKAALTLALRQFDQISDDVSHFCRMFDYRSAGEDWGTSRDSIERAIALLTTRDFRE